MAHLRRVEPRLTVRDLHDRLRGAVAIAWGPEVYFHGRRDFAVLDPDGHMLIFSEGTDDPPTCPGG